MKVEPHPLNTSFEWATPPGPFRRVTAEQARQFDDLGFFVLEGAFDAPTIGKVRAEIDPFEEGTTTWLREKKGGRHVISDADAITFTTHLVTKSPLLRDFVSGPVFTDLCADLVGPDVRLYWDQAVYKKPEKPQPFPWHQDNGYTFVEPQQYLTCWCALTDATEENGCPQVVPGLHKRGTLKHRWTEYGFQCVDDPEGALPAEASAGSIVVFSSLTPHLTGPNVTDSVRKAYIVQFAPDGAVAVRDGGVRETQDDPDRQFPILSEGQPTS